MSDKYGPDSAGLALVLFFTRGVSLRVWDKSGMFEREVSLYRRLQQAGVSVTFVTYGDKNDMDYQDRIPGIIICCNRWKLSEYWYGRLIPWLHRKALKSADLIKSNQMCGADLALAAARHWNKPFLARCGYMWSKNMALEFGRDSERALDSLAVEENVYRSADGITVTTNSMRAGILERFPGLERKIAVIPNFVDTSLFKPARHELSSRPLICFVGRLEQEKNLEALIEAVAGLDVELEIIGSGTLHDKLAAMSVGTPHIRLAGTVPNNRLPDHFHRSALFILPSLYEGHPKTLLEAMACGVPVIGSDVTGINEVITHGQNGLLCATDAASIRQAIKDLLADTALRERLGNNACRYVSEHFSLDRIVEMELQVYRHAISKGRN
jgi:glycosyltransferase involved in cell wall biosynthesis